MGHPQKEEEKMRNRRAIVFFLFWSAMFASAIALLTVSDRSGGEPSGGNLLSVDARDVVKVDIERRTGAGGVRENVSIVRQAGRWRIESPVKAEADEEAVKRLIDSVVFAERGGSLSTADMAGLGRSSRDFGLAVPRCTVTVATERSSDTFFIGRTTAAGDEVYVSRAGRGGLFTVPSRMAEELMRPLVEFRRRRLFTFNPSDVMGMGLKDAGEPLTRLSKSDGQWRIADPVDAPADRQMVEDIIGILCSAQVVDYVADGGSGHGLGDGEGFSIALRDAFGSVEKVVFGVLDGTNSVWAMTPEGAVVHVGRDVLEQCRARQKTLEDSRIFPVDASLVTSISMSEGFPAYVISRSGASAPWSMVSPVGALADTKVVDAFLSRILSLRSADLVAEKSEGSVLVSVSSSVTNFSTRHVSALAMTKDLRFADLLGKTVVRCCKERVKRILVRPAAGEGWNAALSDDVLALLDEGIAAERVETVVLRPNDFDRYGFDRPAYTISFEINDDASSLKRMLIGAVAPGGGRYAMIGGLDVSFVLSASTVSRLTKPVDAPMEKK
jgi:hypothetical protein